MHKYNVLMIKILAILIKYFLLTMQISIKRSYEIYFLVYSKKKSIHTLNDHIVLTSSGKERYE